MERFRDIADEVFHGKMISVFGRGCEWGELANVHHERCNVFIGKAR